ncbi:hypothetical protein G3I44_14400 [Halogeometricum borinquense]|uniref:Uncharacterized protein n=1 Tax=Halogeometricum borinquense TaxID=60847 RepID=A0A6C0UJI4_9EURY|nr:hypothetical protein [Halogeometricum borinquense]QIB75377.1 hypothetical protein G3I44_14400 [Halogeometricum borinquense]
MAVFIKQLYDAKRGDFVTVDDVPKGRLEYDQTVTHVDEFGRRHKYRLYQHNPNQPPYDPYDGEYVHHRNRYKDDEPPFRIFERVNGFKRPDLSFLAHKFHTLWGPGCFRGYFFGGNPPYEAFWERRWIKNAD